MLPKEIKELCAIDRPYLAGLRLGNTLNKSNANDLLVTTLNYLSTNTSLYMIALCLKAGASANLYVKHEKTGSCHVLVYTCISQTRPKDLKTVMLCLRLFYKYGSSLDSLAYKPLEGEQEHTTLTVNNWFAERQGEIDENVLFADTCDLDTQITLLADLITNTKDVTVDDALHYRANSFLPNFQFTKGSMYMADEAGENYLLKLAVRYANSAAYRTFVEKGCIPTYFIVNRILFFIQDYAADKLLSKEYKDMLLYTVSLGVAIDIEQMSIISATDTPYAQALLQIYRQPAWRKVCSGVLELTDEVKNLSFDLNIDASSKSATCDKLLKYSQVDSVRLRKAAIARQKDRLSNDLSDYLDLIENKTTTFTCSNKSSLQSDPFEYNDSSMSYYKDDLGRTFCFPSNLYETLLEKKKNPYTDDPLPDIFLLRVKKHYEILKELGMANRTPVSVTEALQQLHKKDDVSNGESNRIVDTIENLFRTFDIDRKLVQKFKAEDCNVCLKSIGMDQNLSVLERCSSRHRYITFCRAAYYTIKTNSWHTKAFTTAIQSLLYVSLQTTQEKSLEYLTTR
jgi:hypothetical protein